MSEAYLKVMDISQNLARIGNWTADSFDEKQSLIGRFLEQTGQYISELDRMKLPREIRSILSRFKTEFKKFSLAKFKRNKEKWAEVLLTWANIFQSRASIV